MLEWITKHLLLLSVYYINMMNENKMNSDGHRRSIAFCPILCEML